MRLNTIPFKVMNMKVVFVMTVSVPMKKFYVGMFMRMTFGQMQPNTNRHANPSSKPRRSF